MGVGFSSSVFPRSLQGAESTAAESRRSCPICCNPRNATAYLIPCLHQFCLGCAMRSVRQKCKCPLCTWETTFILFSNRSDNDLIVLEIPGLAAPPAEEQQDEKEEDAEPGPGAQAGGFPAEVWADFFQSHPNNIRLLQLWLRQQLEALFEGQCWKVTAWEGIIVGLLCLYGLDVAVLAEKLQTGLQEHTQPFILQLTAAAECLCGTEIRRHLDTQDTCMAREEVDSPAAGRTSPGTTRWIKPNSSLASSRSPARFDVEEEAATLAAALHRGPSSPPSVPVTVEQEEPWEEEDGPAPSPSTPWWVRLYSVLTTFSSTAGFDEEEPSTLEAALYEGPGHPPSVPVTTGQEQPWDEDDGLAASPRTPWWVRLCSMLATLSSSIAGFNVEEEPSTSEAALHEDPGRPPFPPLTEDQKQPWEEDDGPAASSNTSILGWETPKSSLASSTSRASFDVKEEPGTLDATFRGGPSYLPSVPLTAEQKQPQKKPGKVPAAGPCTPSHSRDYLPREPRRPQKSRADSPLDSPQPCKKPRLAGSPSCSPSLGVTPAAHPASPSSSAGPQVAAATGPTSAQSMEWSPVQLQRTRKRKWVPSLPDCPPSSKRLRNETSPGTSLGVTPAAHPASPSSSAGPQVAAATGPTSAQSMEWSPVQLQRPQKRKRDPS